MDKTPFPELRRLFKEQMLAHVDALTGDEKTKALDAWLAIHGWTRQEVLDYKGEE